MLNPDFLTKKFVLLYFGHRFVFFSSIYSIMDPDPRKLLIQRNRICNAGSYSLC